MDASRDNFLRSLSNYSECLRPFLRQIQTKYTTAYYLNENEQVDLSAYCVREREQAQQAKEALNQ
jgi:hypothetical protein